jgi:hypothetical protein
VLFASGCQSNPFAPRPKFVAAPPSAETTAAAPPGPPATFGASLEDIDARNRADIATRLGRPVAPGPATPAEVAAMTRAGVEPRFIICYINRSTNLAPIGAEEVIYLHQQGVDDQVIQAMLTPGAADSRAEVARSMPPRMLILTGPYWPYYYPHYGVACGYGYGWY